MRTLTKLFCTAFLLMAGFVSASAQVVEEDGEKVYATFESPSGITWDADNKTFSWSSQYGNQLHNIGLPNGNLAEYSQLVVDCEVIEGDGYRFMFYANDKGTTAGGITIIEKKDLAESTKKVYNLADFNMDQTYLTNCAEICLSGLNASGKVKVNSVYLIKSKDPLVGYKKQLSDAITIGEMQSDYAKTKTSWDEFTAKLAAAKEALDAADATAESLETATNELNAAISNLKLTVGYTNLTQEMFQGHTAQGEAGTGQAGCAYDLFKSTGMPYGDGNVFWLNYADLSGYDKLIVVAAAGTPRFCMNRTENNAQDNDDPETSKFIDIPNHAWGTEAYQTKDGDNVWIIDLKKMVEERGFAYLHSMKGAGGNVTVTDMLLYKEMSYGIVGDLTGGWDADVEMAASEEDGIYTLTIEGFEAEAKTYEYKLRANKAWGIYELPASGNNNWTCKYPGKYTLVFTADVLNHSLALEAINEVPIDIEIAPEAGADIAAELAAAKEGIAKVGNITINLQKGAEYTVSKSIEATRSLTINGNDAIIDASALGAPFINYPAVEGEFAMKDETTPSAYVIVDQIRVAGIKVNGLANSIINNASGVKTLFKNVLFDWVNIELIGSKNVFALGAAYANDFTIQNSTIWSKEGQTGFFFKADGKPADVNASETTTWTVDKCLLYNIAVGKKANNSNGGIKGKSTTTMVLTNSILYNFASSTGNEVNGWLWGQNGGANATYANNAYLNADGVVSGWTDTSKNGSDQTGTSIVGNIKFTDAANGDFNGTLELDPDSATPESLGAPMWTLNIVKLNKYTATFTTNAGWEEVYAYAWSGDGETATKFLGDWPGTKLELNAETSLYDVIIKAEAAPEKIIFNSGKGAQTEDLVFEDGKAYEYTVEESTLMAEAEALAADPDGVAVGKLLAAIQDAKDTGNEDNLQAAIDQFKTDNLDQEKDETPKVDVDWQKWNGATGFATWAAPQVTTYDGRTTYVVENYNGGSGSVTGEIFSQTITGLATGDYKVAFFANANSTADRDTAVETGMEDGATDVAYVFANDAQEFIVAHRAISIEANGEYSFEMTLTEADNGTIKLGLGKAKAGTNWHTMQIKQLTWFTTAKAVYAADQNELSTLLAKAKDMVADENKTNGKEELSAAIAAGDEAATEKKTWYNIPELEEIINNLKAAMDNFKKANWFIEFAAGEYYIIDTESGYFMAAGHDYGTRGIINEIGLDLTLTPYEASRTVTINSRVSNGGNSHFLGNNLYMDGAEWGWALEYQGFGFYILEPNSNKYINIDENDNLVLSDTPREFIIVEKQAVFDERMEELEDADAENPVDATFLLQHPNFNRNDQRVSAWEWIPSETEEENKDNWNNHNFNGGNGVNNCAESFHAAFTVKQTVSGAPAGFYQMTAQGFFRQDTYEGEQPAAPVFFANEVNGDVPALAEGGPDGMNTASEAFTKGEYTIDPITFEVKEDGMIYVGITTAVHNQWVIWDNFQLKYFGQDNPTTGITTLATVAEQNNGTGIYNLNGQKVMNAKKGLYIVNGKKVVLK